LGEPTHIHTDLSYKKKDGTRAEYYGTNNLSDPEQFLRETKRHARMVIGCNTPSFSGTIQDVTPTSPVRKAAGRGTSLGGWIAAGVASHMGDFQYMMAGFGAVALGILYTTLTAGNPKGSRRLSFKIHPYIIPEDPEMLAQLEALDYRIRHLKVDHPDGTVRLKTRIGHPDHQA